MGVLPISLASIHLATNWVNTCERIEHHTPLISNYSSTSNCLLASECDVVLGQYCRFATDVLLIIAEGSRIIRK